MRIAVAKIMKNINEVGRWSNTVRLKWQAKVSNKKLYETIKELMPRNNNYHHRVIGASSAVTLNWRFSAYGS